jgi:hypothetical protein
VIGVRLGSVLGVTLEASITLRLEILFIVDLVSGAIGCNFRGAFDICGGFGANIGARGFSVKGLMEEGSPQGRI